MCRRATLNLLLNRININFYYQLFKILKLFYTAVDRILDIFFGYSLVSGWQQERSTNLMKNKFWSHTYYIVTPPVHSYKRGVNLSPHTRFFFYKNQ